MDCLGEIIYRLTFGRLVANGSDDELARVLSQPAEACCGRLGLALRAIEIIPYIKRRGARKGVANAFAHAVVLALFKFVDGRCVVELHLHRRTACFVGASASVRIGDLADADRLAAKLQVLPWDLDVEAVGLYRRNAVDLDGCGGLMLDLHFQGERRCASELDRYCVLNGLVCHA